MSKPLRILISGARGQLGTDSQDVLAGHVLLPLDLPNLDITSPASLDGILDLWRPDAIVNCAAFTAVDRAETARDAAFAVNRDGPALLADRAAKHSIFLVHVSTDYVFDGARPLPRPYLESDPTDPQNVYGASKLAGEQAVLAAAPGVSAILRTAWLYGANGHNFLKTILRRARKFPDSPLRVVNDQFGSPTWSFTLARQIAAVLDARATGLFHASGEGVCTWFDFASEFLRLMQIPVAVHPCSSDEFPSPTKRPTNSILENAALKKLGIHVMRDWHDDLADYVALHRDRLLAETAPD